MVYRFTISEKPAFICMLRSTGNPFISAENKMPKMSGGKRLPKKITQSHAFFHACFSTFPRNSNATPRPISESKRRTKRTYDPLNSVAYQFGKAANIAPIAEINQTSFASQKGPIVLIKARRSKSFLPKKRDTIPIPKSKPSKKIKPTNRMDTSKYQNSLRENIVSLLCKRIS